ncbi:MAG TPA: hypothetical protein VE422_08200 [Terriglobia bacterium]|nr:hypothetical protein [Terriglobia bacterium]
MNAFQASVRSAMRRFARRVAVGHFLEIWPLWAVPSLLLAGLIALVCRMFFPSAAEILVWLWLAPVVAIFPAFIICIARAYRPSEIVALADSLDGGQGLLLTLLETGDPAWTGAPALENFSRRPLPRLRPRRLLWKFLPAAAFLLAALLVPQRVPAGPGNTILANDIAEDLKTTLAELTKRDLITPAEEKKLEEEIERIRKSALERVDSSSWEAADALREKLAANLSEKHDALKWAQESLARYAAASAQGVADNPAHESDIEEIARAIETLSRSGLLADAPADLRRLLGGSSTATSGNVRLATDARSLRKLADSLSTYLAKRSEGLRDLSRLGKESGWFDPSEYPQFSYDRGPDGDGDPGSGGLNRGRGDAPLTWGKESLPFDRFKAVALPPGAVRSPDDWAPVAVLPGAPKASPEIGAQAPAQDYAGTAGQAAWRRTLVPRHRSAVKKYFENSPSAR